MTENENLVEMIKKQEEEQPKFSESDLDTPAEEENIEEGSESQEENENQTQEYEISTVSLSTWFEQNHERFENINHVKVAIRGIDASKTLIMSVLVPVQEGVGETPKRKLFIFEDADVTPVLDLPGLSMEVFNNGFRVVYNFNDDIYLKCYGVKTGLFIVFCKNINSQLIPYALTKVKRKDSGLNVVRIGTEEIISKLPQPEDTEALQILYKQIGKHVSGINTKQDTINWFLERQESVMDINHHLQIDNILIRTLL